MNKSAGVRRDVDRQRIVLDYLAALDGGGPTPSGVDLFDLFTDDAEMFFPKWGIARGKDEIGRMIADIGGTLVEIRHDPTALTWMLTGTDLIGCEGVSSGVHRDGRWTAGQPDWGAGRWCDVFQLRGERIARCYVYLDPDYANQDLNRYPWLVRHHGGSPR